MNADDWNTGYLNETILAKHKQKYQWEFKIHSIGYLGGILIGIECNKWNSQNGSFTSGGDPYSYHSNGYKYSHDGGQQQFGVKSVAGDEFVLQLECGADTATISINKNGGKWYILYDQITYKNIKMKVAVSLYGGGSSLELMSSSVCDDDGDNDDEKKEEEIRKLRDSKLQKKQKKERNELFEMTQKYEKKELNELQKEYKTMSNEYKEQEQKLNELRAKNEKLQKEQEEKLGEIENKLTDMTQKYKTMRDQHKKKEEKFSEIEHKLQKKYDKLEKSQKVKIKRFEGEIEEYISLINKKEEEEKEKNDYKDIGEILFDLNDKIIRFKKEFNEERIKIIYNKSPEKLIGINCKINKNIQWHSDNIEGIMLSSNAFNKYLNDLILFIKNISIPNPNNYKKWNLKEIMAWIISLEQGEYLPFADKLRDGFKKSQIISGDLLPELTRSDLSNPPFNIDEFIIKRDLIKHFKLLSINNNNNKNEIAQIPFVNQENHQNDEGVDTAYIDK